MKQQAAMHSIKPLKSADSPVWKFLKKGFWFVLVVGATYGFFLKSVDFASLKRALLGADPLFVGLGITAMALFVACEGLNIGRGLKAQGITVSFAQKIRYACYGFFFSAITPSSSGGQPLQIYTMRKDRIGVAQSSLALLFELMGFQIATMTYALLGLASQAQSISQTLGAFMLLVYLGLGINALVLMFLLTAIFSSTFSGYVMRFALWVVQHVVPQKAYHFKEKAEGQLDLYRRGAQMIKRKPRVFIGAVLTSLVQIGALHSVTYCAYRALGLSGQSFITLFLLQAVLFISVSALPIPGAVGASEGGFLLLYATIFSRANVSAGMVLSRTMSFYLPVVLTGCAVAVYGIQRSSRA